MDSSDKLAESGGDSRKLVLVSTAIMFSMSRELDLNSDEADQPLRDLSERLRRAVALAFRDDPNVEVIGAVGFRYPEEEQSNIQRCAKCGAWLTDRDLPNPCDALMHGILEDGEYLCASHGFFSQSADGSTYAVGDF